VEVNGLLYAPAALNPGKEPLKLLVNPGACLDVLKEVKVFESLLGIEPMKVNW
jgi:hypothetical protein